MKKLVIAISLLFALSLAGCLPTTTKQQSSKSQVEGSASSSEAENASLGLDKSNENQLIAAAPAAGKKEVKRFYPDSGSVPTGETSGSSGTVSDSERSFNITPELIAKMHLVDKYNPGVCFGMPGPVPQSAIDSLINGNKALSDFVKQKYNLSSDLEIYNKLKQFQNVQLTVISSSKYEFKFMDGQCCTMTYYQGVIEVSGDKAIETIENKETKTNPC
ncbi:MAG: hypothetical protein BWY53_00275 [Parcubacteria group bacterium ADurb.Bin326]|nr:MAG: hypothetical protein BWY53_00275 [Parcubacteria group bacterium ADurb.Bin326]